jgi:hypothetical protein
MSNLSGWAPLRGKWLKRGIGGTMAFLAAAAVPVTPDNQCGVLALFGLAGVLVYFVRLPTRW